VPILPILLRLLLCVALVLNGVAAAHVPDDAVAGPRMTAAPADPVAGASGGCHEVEPRDSAAGVSGGHVQEDGCCDGAGCACGCLPPTVAPPSAMGGLAYPRPVRVGAAVDVDRRLAPRIGDLIRPPIG
jgi:hypothetical protein